MNIKIRDILSCVIIIVGIIIINIYIKNVLSVILTIFLFLYLLLKIIIISKKKNITNVLKIGLICYDTQYSQLKEIISDANIEVTRISEEGKNKIEKLYNYIVQITNVNLIYYGYGVSFFPIKIIIAKILNKKVIMHWIGTDVLDFKNSKYKNIVKICVDLHFACSNLISKELQSYGIKSITIPIVPLNMNFNLSKMPEKHAALFYLPSNREEFYGVKYLYFLARKFDNIEFYVVGNEKMEFEEKNIINLGKISLDEMNKLYNNISILVRIPEHDGLSIMLLEALMRGKYVLYCYDFPFVYSVNSFEDAGKYFSKIIEKKPAINKGSREYILENYNVNIIKKKLREVLEKNNFIENKGN